MHSRTPLIYLIFSVILFSSHCQSRSWTNSLPTDQPPYTIDHLSLSGLWIRNVESRHGVVDKLASTQGYEIIEINGLNYRKIHEEIENIEGKRITRRYEENGTLETKGYWLLFKPVIGIFRMDLGSGWLESQVSADVSLFYIDTSHGSITPLMYERLGKTYEFGIVEGCVEPYDGSSRKFKNALSIYNEKSFHQHGYFKRKPKSVISFE